MSNERLEDIEALIAKTRDRGDECFAVLLEGIRMYVALGREMDLLESMRDFEREVRPAVEGTPSADQLQQLYDRPEGSGLDGSEVQPSR